VTLLRRRTTDRATALRAGWSFSALERLAEDL
jgi:hypothetical protein